MEERPGKIGVLVVENDRLMFEGLSILVGDELDMRVVGVATTAADAVEKARLLRPDVVLMDYHLPDRDGPHASEEITRLLPDASILFLSADTSEGAVQRAVESGACGYISKTAPAEELLTGIRRVADGEYLLEAATVARLADQRRRSQVRPSQQVRKALRLTPPEENVLAQMARGLDNAEIAGALGLEAPVVRGHVRRILEKLGAHSKMQAVTLAKQAGLL